MMQFAIWGMGKNGRWLFELLGRKSVKIIVERDPEYHGSIYLGIPVVSPDVYIKKYRDVPIIITPRNAEAAIKEQLESQGVYNVFCFSDNVYLLESFLKQVSAENLIKDYQKSENIVIYGLNVLGILLYQFLIERGYSCGLLLQEGASLYLEQYAEKKLEMQIESWGEIQIKADRLLLALEPSGEDIKRIQGFSKCRETFYDLPYRKNLYYYADIEKFKGNHKNQRCFIVATGPSLKIKDLDKLYKQNEICISVNGIFQAFNRTLWRPDYYIIDDPTGVLIWRKNILQADIKEKFIADSVWFFDTDEVASNMHKWHFQRAQKEEEEPEFSEDFARISYCGATIVFDGALQLAAYMGFTEIYLIGVDCCRYESVEKQHFSPAYDDVSKQVNLNVERNILAYRSAKKYADNHGISIYNATRGGELEVFERVNFDELFEKQHDCNGIADKPIDIIGGGGGYKISYTFYLIYEIGEAA